MPKARPSGGRSPRAERRSGRWRLCPPPSRARPKIPLHRLLCPPARLRLRPTRTNAGHAASRVPGFAIGASAFPSGTAMNIRWRTVFPSADPRNQPGQIPGCGDGMLPGGHGGLAVSPYVPDGRACLGARGGCGRQSAEHWGACFQVPRPWQNSEREHRRNRSDAGLNSGGFPGRFPETSFRGFSVSSKPNAGAASAVAEHRRRLRGRGLQRLELQVRGEDAPLLRAVAAALADPGKAAEARALLRGRFAPPPVRSLKDLLASAPLDGVDLVRSRDTGRAVDL